MPNQEERAGGCPLSVVVPAYNEETRLGAAIAAYLGALPAAAEVVIVDDGSTDATAEVARALARADARVRVLRLPENRGKGFAVRAGVLAARGDRVLMADADGSAAITELARLAAALDAGADIAVGSREGGTADVRVRADPWRRFAGRTFHQVVRLAGIRDIRDTQCGFKLFRRSAARVVFGGLRTPGYAFDVEILLRARRAGLRVVEVPVSWSHRPGGKVRVVRDGIATTLAVLRIRAARPRAEAAHAAADASARGEDDARRDADASRAPEPPPPGAEWRWRVGLTVCVLVLLAPILLFGYPAQSDDGVWHAMWYRHFSAQLWGGEAYPRWLRDTNYGLGSPSFFFYGPVPYYLASLFRPLAGGREWTAVGIGAAVAAVASAQATYAWLRSFVARRPALGGTLFHVASPYYLAFDHYRRGGYAEGVAFVWMPLTLLAAERLWTRDPRRIAGFGVACALLLMTHPPTSLEFLAVPVAYAVWVAPAGRRSAAVAAVTLGVALGIALSAAYLATALGDQAYVSFPRMRTGMGHYERSFLLTSSRLGSGPAGTLAVLTYAMLSLVAAAGAGAAAARRGPASLRTRASFWLAVALGAAVMTTPLSAPVWRSVPLLQAVQFPWRFLTVVTIASAAAVACGLEVVARLEPRSRRAFRAALACVAAGWVPYTVYAARSGFPELAPNPERQRVVALRLHQDRDAPEYEPRWSPGLPRMDHADSLADVLTPAGRVPRVRVARGAAQVAVLEWRPRHILLSVRAASDATLDVGQFYYQGWQATSSRDGRTLGVRPSPRLGNVQVDVVPGVQTVALRLAAGRHERAGRRVSAVALAVCVATVIGGTLRRGGSRRRVRAPAPAG